MARLIGLAILAALCATASGVRAVETGSMPQGHDLARAACSECHAVENDDAFSPMFPAPTFRHVAQTPGMTATALSVALRTLHRDMPDFILKPDEIDDLTAYILSLARKP
jgi:mono/diheme cytochrome c family protein